MNDTIEIDVNILDRYGQTPLDDAIRHGHNTLKTMLKVRNGHEGADPELEQAQRDAEAQVAEEQAQQVPSAACLLVSVDPHDAPLLYACDRTRHVDF